MNTRSQVLGDRRRPDGENVLDILRRMGCDVGQGYYFGRPMESEEISRLLRDDAPAPARKPATTG